MIRWSILSIIIGYVLRLWIFRQIFSKHDKSQLITISLRSGFYALLAFFIYNISHFLPTLSGAYSDYLIIVSILSIIIIPRLPHGGRWRLGQSLLWFTLKLWLWWSLATYSLSARWEESLKRNSLKKQSFWLIQSMILWWIVSALIFGQIENVIYIVSAFLQWQNSESLISLLGQRSLLPIIVHIGSLCLWFCGILWIRKKNPYFRLLWWIAGLLSIGSHFLYNIAQMSPSLSVLKVALIIIYCISIHYCLFKSDTLYTQSQKQE